MRSDPHSAESVSPGHPILPSTAESLFFAKLPTFWPILIAKFFFCPSICPNWGSPHTSQLRNPSYDGESERGPPDAVFGLLLWIPSPGQVGGISFICGLPRPPLSCILEDLWIGRRGLCLVEFKSGPFQVGAGQRRESLDPHEILS